MKSSPTDVQKATNRLATLGADWLNNNTSTNAATSSTLTYWPNNWISTYGRIRLTLSEVQKLRAAAKRDKTVKAILQKFTDHIELVVDFE